MTITAASDYMLTDPTTESVSLQDSLIMIVEDGMTSAAVLTHLLSDAGFRIACASSGEEAVESAPFLKPDLILLDIKMEGMDGFETCQKLKAKPQLRDVPIFFTSSLNDKESKLKGFRSGAVDYITKPYHREELIARIQIHLRFRYSYKALMAAQFKQLSSLREAQHDLLPKPQDFPEANFASFYSAKNQAGGDFFDILPISDHITDYIVADVSGHEIGSSLATAALRSALRQNHQLAYQPGENLALVNNLLQEFLKPGQYATLAYLRLNREQGKADLWNAAHTPVLQASSEIKIWEVPGDPIGCFEEFTPGTLQFSVEPGDRLNLFSDGIIEEFQGNPITRTEGLEHLRTCLSGSASLSLQDAVKRTALHLHPEPQIAEDDLLLLGIEV